MQRVIILKDLLTVLVLLAFGGMEPFVQVIIISNNNKLLVFCYILYNLPYLVLKPSKCGDGICSSADNETCVSCFVDCPYPSCGM